MANSDAPKIQSDESSGVVKASRLLSLPQELQDIIFDLAYPRQDGVKFLSRRQWENREKETRRANASHILRRSPPPKADEFLVCKQYFACAARAWVSNQHFDSDYDQAFNTIASSLLEPNGTEIVRPNVTTLTVRHYFTSDAIRKYLPRLKNLTIHVSYHDFESLEPKFAWTYAFDEDDFVELEKALGFDKLRGLCSLRLIPRDCHYAATSQEKKLWVDNVHAFEAHLKPSVTLAKGERNTMEESRDRGFRPVSETSLLSLAIGTSTGEALTSGESHVSLPTMRLSDPKSSTTRPSVQPKTAQMSGAVSPGEKESRSTPQQPVRPRSAADRSRRASDVARSGSEASHTMKRGSILGPTEQSHKMACRRSVELGDQIAQRLLESYAQSRFVTKEASRSISMNRQKPVRSILGLRSVEQNAPHKPEAGSAAEIPRIPESGRAGTEARDDDLVSKATADELFYDTQGIPSRAIQCLASPYPNQGAQSALRKGASSSREPAVPNTHPPIRVTIPGTRLQPNFFDVDDAAASARHARHSDIDNHTSSRSHSMEAKGVDQANAVLTNGPQAAELRVSDLQVAFEVIPSVGDDATASKAGSAFVPPEDVTHAGPAIEGGKRSINGLVVPNTFAGCPGATQETVSKTISCCLEVPGEKSAKSARRNPEHEPCDEELKTKHRSPIDAMKQFVRKERELLGDALLALSSGAENVRLQDVPDTAEEIMALLVKDSRTVVNLLLEAKKKELAQLEEQRVLHIDQPATAGSKAESHPEVDIQVMSGVAWTGSDMCFLSCLLLGIALVLGIKSLLV